MTAPTAQWHAAWQMHGSNCHSSWRCIGGNADKHGHFPPQLEQEGTKAVGTFAGEWFECLFGCRVVVFLVFCNVSWHVWWFYSIEIAWFDWFVLMFQSMSIFYRIQTLKIQITVGTSLHPLQNMSDSRKPMAATAAAVATSKSAMRVSSCSFLNR